MSMANDGRRRSNSGSPVSIARGKVFAARPDFVIESVTRMIRVNPRGQRVDDYILANNATRETPLSLPRVRWLEGRS